MSDIKTELLAAIDLGKLHRSEGDFVLCGAKRNYINTLTQTSQQDEVNKGVYDTDTSVAIYRNFLNWLFATFKIPEEQFRKECIAHLQVARGARVLVTSCGLGEDVSVCCDAVGEEGFVHAQDLSGQFIAYAADRIDSNNVAFTVSNALDLPYKDNYFDAVYHFGGINLFGDINQAVHEMSRVCKVGGRVLFGDESVAPHLRQTDYGKMFIKNNRLWEEPLPLECIPPFAQNLFVRYVLGNCFYLIGFDKGADYPAVDMDVEHVGYRGGSARKRYYGELEGVDVNLKRKLYEYAKANGKSVSSLLEGMIERLWI